MSEHHMEILRHSLGLGRGKGEYRNHFAAESGSPDYAACEELVASGYMVKGRSLGYGHYFHVTEDGKAIARAADCPTP